MDGRAASVARVAAKIALPTDPSAMQRSATPAGRPGSTRSGSIVTASPAGDEREADVRVVGAVADVRIEAAELAAGALRDRLPAEAGMGAGPDLVGQLGQRHRVAVAARHPVPDRQDEVDGVSQELVALHACRQRQWLVLPLVAGRRRRRRSPVRAAPARALPR